MIRKRKTKNNGGYTLVELLVAMTVFIILITMILSIFTQGLRSHRSLISIMNVSNNSFLAMEQMMREIRVGVHFKDSVGGNCPPGFFPSLSFFSYEDGDTMREVEYRLENDAIIKEVGPEKVELTSRRNLKVENFCFRRVQGGQHTNDLCNPWRITVLMEVRSDRWGSDHKASIQNTVSSRILPKEVPFEVSQDYAYCRQD